MRKSLTALAALLLLASCGGNAARNAASTATESTEVADMHNAENSLDIAGVYKGTLPAADCPGIDYTLTLSPGGKYTEHMSYIDRNTEVDNEGTYTVEGDILTTTPATQGDRPGYYKVEEGQLRWLDADKNPVPGEIGEHYIIKKTTEK